MPAAGGGRPRVDAGRTVSSPDSAGRPRSSKPPSASRKPLRQLADRAAPSRARAWRARSMLPARPSSSRRRSCPRAGARATRELALRRPCAERVGERRQPLRRPARARRRRRCRRRGRRVERRDGCARGVLDVDERPHAAAAADDRQPPARDVLRRSSRRARSRCPGRRSSRSGAPGRRRRAPCARARERAAPSA